MAGFLAVYPDTAVVVDCTEIEQCTVVLCRYSLETRLKPDSAFIEEEPFILRIPVRGNPHGGRLVEVVFDEVFGPLGFGVDEESPASGVHAVVIIPLFLYIDDVMPVTV